MHAHFFSPLKDPMHFILQLIAYAKRVWFNINVNFYSASSQYSPNAPNVLVPWKQ